MNDDGGVDVGMDHGGETELKMQVHPLMVRSNAVPLMLAPMAGWLLRRCTRATSTISFGRGDCISLASGPAMSLERAKRTNYVRRRGWSPPNRRYPQQGEHARPPKHQTGEVQGLKPSVLVFY